MSITEKQAARGYKLAFLLDVIPDGQYDHGRFSNTCRTKGCAIGHAIAFGVTTRLEFCGTCGVKDTGVLGENPFPIKEAGDVMKEEFGFSDLFFEGYWSIRYPRPDPFDDCYKATAADMSKEIRLRLKNAGHPEPEETPVFESRDGLKVS